MSNPKPTQDENPLLAPETLLTIAAAGGAAWIAAGWPLLASSTFKGHPKLIDPVSGIGGIGQWISHGFHGSPKHVHAWHRYAALLPSKSMWFAFELAGLAILAGLGYLAWRRVDGWRSRRDFAVKPSSLRAKVKPRSWATARDFKTKQGRRRQIDPDDWWPIGRIAGSWHEQRSKPELHMTVVAPTRSGKTSRFVIPSVRRHNGPAVVLSNKLDVLEHTLEVANGERPDLRLRADDRPGRTSRQAHRLDPAAGL